jgi:hypothetical protein
MPKNVGSVRRSQLITTYGVGAIVASGDESFMVAGLDRWTVGRPNIHEPRLERMLQVQGFVYPPATGADGGNDVPVVRFPEMHYCPSCRRLEKHRFFCRPSQNKCNTCGTTLVPSRFVVACSKGHIDDFPYFEWVHQGKNTQSGDHVPSIEASGISASLSDIIISCTCGAARSMEGGFSKWALRYVRQCKGSRPWLGDYESCDEIPRTMQRGASNTYFSIVRSSISIPPWSEGALKLINKYWQTLRHIRDQSALGETIEGMRLAEDSPFKVADLVRAVEQRRSGEDASVNSMEELRRQEYEALLVGKEEVSPSQDFVCVPVQGVTETAGEWFESAMAVKRLREVRALQSFTRLLPPSPGDEEDRRASLSCDSIDWLPAAEVLGEGIFLDLKRKRLQDWERRDTVIERANRINANYARRFHDHGQIPDRVITPRFLLIHTLAHALITQWSLDCGYPAASLRERLFVEAGESEMMGFLVYTATTDSAGSLGGIVARANPQDLRRDLLEAVARSSWCSADPLCIEADAAGVDALNMAACHACVLLPEVSCEEGNMLLDRAMLVGTPGDPGIGFFAGVLEETANARR